MTPTFTASGVDLYQLLQEVDKYKAYLSKQTDERVAFTSKDIIKDGSMTLFGAEIFQFWVAALRIRSTEKAVFIEFAKSIGIPVRDYDNEPDGLSYLGRNIYAVWCEAINLAN